MQIRQFIRRAGLRVGMLRLKRKAGAPRGYRILGFIYGELDGLLKAAPGRYGRLIFFG